MKKKSQLPGGRRRQYLKVGINDIATVIPDLAKKWSPNNPNKPSEYHIGSGQRALWVNTCGHEWEAEIRTEARRETSFCPKCPTPQRPGPIPSQNQLKEEYSDRNKKPLDFTKNKSTTLKIWNCSTCSHEYKKSLPRRLEGYGCIPCSKRGAPLNETHPHLKQHWSNANQLTIESYSKARTDKVQWKCNTCSGEWITAINVQANKKMEHACPYCSNNKTLAGFNDLATTHPTLAREWSLKNKESSGTIRANESVSVLWRAGCGHEWRAKVCDRANKNSKCPYCSNQKVLKGFNDVISLKPFVIPLWSPSNLLKPEDLKASDQVNKIILRCKKGHEWEVLIGNVEDPILCKVCSGRATSRAEQAIFNYITSLGAEAKRFDRSVLGDKELDIYLPKHNIAIEYNGFYWHSEKMGKNNKYHFNKWNECKNKGIDLLYIWEDEWRQESKKIQTFFKELIIKGEVPKMQKSSSLEKTTNNGSLEELYYKYNGFTISRAIPPSTFFVKAGMRYELEYFKNLGWDSKQIEDNNFYKIWNAGKTFWIKGSVL